VAADHFYFFGAAAEAVEAFAWAF